VIEKKYQRRAFPEEASDCDGFGLELCDSVEKLLHCSPGVDDVLHDQDVLAADGGVYVLHADDFHLCMKLHLKKFQESVLRNILN